MPTDANITSKYGQYKTSVQQNGNNIEIIRKYIFFPGRITISDYPEFYSFIQDIKTAENKNVILLK